MKGRDIPGYEWLPLVGEKPDDDDEDITGRTFLESTGQGLTLVQPKEGDTAETADRIELSNEETSSISRHQCHGDQTPTPGK